MRVGDEVELARDHFPWKRGQAGTIVEDLSEKTGVEDFYAVEMAPGSAAIWVYARSLMLSKKSTSI